jgi:RNA polymerase sigma-70 factor (ECF subfamily)
MITKDDHELIREAIDNRAAFAELYRQYVNKVYRYFIFKVGNRLDAQELTSQTFLAALENIASYRGDGSFASWLFGIASRKAAQFYSRQKFKFVELGEEINDCLTPLDQSVEQGLEFSRVLRALDHLSNDRAEAIRLYFFSGLTVTEVAITMGKSEAAVRMLVHRSLNDLKRRLDSGEAT